MTALSFDVFWRDHGASKGAKGLGTDVDRTAGKFDKFKGAAVAAGAIAGAAIFKFGKDSVAAYSESEQAQTRLQDAFRKFPKLADTNIGALRSLNTQLAAKTRFDDDATASGQAVLAQFKLTGTQITQLTPLLQDYAAKTGKDLPTAARDLGKAMLGQGRSLKAVGIDFKDTGSAGGNFTQIMGGLRTQVGGFASKEGKTAAGQAAILKNQFGELQETAGSKLLPALLKIGGALLGAIGFVQRNGAAVKVLVGVVGGLAVGLYALIVAERIHSFILAQSAGRTILWAVASKVAAGASKAWAAGQWLLNAALTANPIGIVVVAIAALVGGLILAYKKSETFRRIVDGAFRLVAKAAQTAFGWIRKNWPLLLAVIVGPIGLAARAVIKNWDKITAGARAMKDAVVRRFQDVVGFVRSLPRRIFNALGAVHRLLFVKGRQVIDGLQNGAQEKWRAASAWLSGLPGRIRDKFANAARLLFVSGRRLLAGLYDGMVDKVRDAGAWARNIGGTIVRAVKSFFGISSPSKVFAGIGRHLASGLFKGMIESHPGAAVRKIFGSMPDALGALVNKGMVSISSLPGRAMNALAGLGGKFAGLLDGIGGFGGGGGGGTTGGLIAFGRWLQSMGYSVTEHPAFGGVGTHSRGSLHYSGQAIDVNAGAGTSAAEQGRLAKIIGPAHQAGFRTIFMAPGHYNHAHVSLFGGGVIPEEVFGVGRSGRTYSFGEKGPETVIPGQRRGASGTTINVTINAPVGSHPREIGRELVRYIRAYERSN